jgi:type VI secretion system protein
LSYKQISPTEPVEKVLVRGAVLALCLVVAALSQGCGIGVKTRALVGGKVKVQVFVSQNANQNNPVAVDLLMVYDKNLLKELTRMSAKEWFEKREQIRRDYSEGTGFDAWEWEWVPGQNVNLQELPLKPAAIGGLVFANYLTNGVHRGRFDPHTSVAMNFLETTFTVEPVK